jgi:hypothetical protein
MMTEVEEFRQLAIKRLTSARESARRTHSRYRWLRLETLNNTRSYYQNFH